MKRILLIALILLVAIPTMAEKILYKTLDNGLEVVVNENQKTNNTAVYCFVKTGSIHEGEYLGAGLSHWLEHVVSGGSTTLRTEKEYIDIRKQYGIMSNAYTTYEATAYHLLGSAQMTDVMIELLSENMFECAFDSTEVYREKDVILKEFVYRSAPPIAKLYQRFQERVYHTANYRSPIIGHIDIYRTMEREHMMDYYNKRYVPNNMVVVVSGNFDGDHVMSKVEEFFGKPTRGIIYPVDLPSEQVRKGEFKYVDEFEIEQPMGFISRIVPASDYRDVVKLEVAANVLFGKRESPVKMKLVEELKLANNIYGWFEEPATSTQGNLTIRIDAKDAKDMDRIVEVIDEEIAKFVEIGVTQDQIDNYINRSKADRILKAKEPEDQCNEFGWSVMKYGKPDLFDIRMDLITDLTPEEVTETIKKYYLSKDRVVFYGVPVGSKKELQQQEEKEIIVTDVEKIEVSDELTLLYKHNNIEPVINVSVFVPMSTDYETEKNIGTFNFVANLMFSGSKNYPSLELSSWAEDHLVYPKINVNRDGFFIDFKCIKEDLPEAIKILKDAFENPTFEQSEIDLAKKDALSKYNFKKTDSESQHSEFRGSILYKGTRDGASQEERNNIIQNITRDEVIDIYENYFMGEEMVISLFGDISKEKATDYAKEIRESVKDNTPDGERVSLEVPDMSGKFENEYNFEQVNVDINTTAPKMDDKYYDAFKVIDMIFAGNGGRLHEATRGVNDLAYFAYSRFTSSSDYGFFRITSQTSGDKKEELLNVLKGEIEKLKQGQVTQEEINSSVDETYMMYKYYITDERLASFALNYEVQGLGYDYLDKMQERFKKVTPEMIKEAANMYFNNLASFISYPSADVKKIVE